MNYLAEIRLYASADHVPAGWQICDGTLLSVSKHRDLFSLVKNQFGGDAANFAVPNLMGRLALGAGQDPETGVDRVQGLPGGANQTTLRYANMPIHTHSLKGSEAAGLSAQVANKSFASPKTAGADRLTYAPDKGETLTTMDFGMIAANIGNKPFDICQPVLGMVFAMALSGIFPSKP